MRRRLAPLLAGFRPGFPRDPRGAIERDAVEGTGGSCCLAHHDGWGCTRGHRHRGDHVAAGSRQVFDRWRKRASPREKKRPARVRGGEGDAE